VLGHGIELVDRSCISTEFAKVVSDVLNKHVFGQRPLMNKFGPRPKMDIRKVFALSLTELACCREEVVSFVSLSSLINFSIALRIT